jgi:5-methylthioadenosine/S-adenosylhomocysteine deaminase
MSLVPADLRIDARWILPMTARDMVLRDHSLLVRDGRILEILPSRRAAERYSASVTLTRASHLLMPGMVNTDARGADAHRPDSRPPDSRPPQNAGDGVLNAIAQMLKSGITTFADRYSAPDAVARAAHDQGLRVLIGMPVAEFATPWARTAAEYLSRALALRDEYRGHPLVSTAFAPLAANNLTDATFARLATLADELDAGITLDVNSCRAEILECETQHGVRPMQRLGDLGLLTPALNAVHMVAADAADIELAQRSGISVSLSPQMNLHAGWGLPPAAALVAARLRVGLGSANAGPLGCSIWGEMKLLALMLHAADLGAAPWSAWDAVAAATHAGATILGLDGEVGTLESGKWADLCCVDLGGAEEFTHDPIQALVYAAGPDTVTDVWVAGRQLLSQRELTRLDWPARAASAG